ncbi:MAG: hypothetical protein S4CHLAM37_01190 [Chlamydiia bacterium]|nr:hypothetical protein [Chlamydiia bacterium]
MAAETAFIVHRELADLARNPPQEPKYTRPSSETLKTLLMSRNSDAFKELFVDSNITMTFTTRSSEGQEIGTYSDPDEIATRIIELFEKINFSRFGRSISSSESIARFYGEGLAKSDASTTRCVWLTLTFNKNNKISSCELDDIKSH